jgi:hypothetical protein
MRAGNVERIEGGIGLSAAACLAAALGFAVYHAVDRLTGVPGMIAAAGFSAIAAYPAAAALLHVLEGPTKPFPQPVFDMVEIEPVQPDELLLADADRLPAGDAQQPLVLDDILVGIAPDSRVVQLFDRSAMPSPGQLKTRVNQHLDGGTPHSPPPDASEALFAALAELRRSLR